MASGAVPMAFGSGSGSRQGGTTRLMPDLDVNDWHEAPKQPRDAKKLALVVGLGLLSWVATYVGMLELIEANMGDLPLVHKLIIGFSVAMLMTMVVWLLDQLFAPIGAFTKLIYAAGYIFLTVISVGFGFGFYWKVLESRSEASRSAEGAVGQVQTSLFAASTRLEQLQQTLDGLTTMSTGKAATERASGTSCPNSKPGDGPRRKLRDDDAARFSFASEFVKGRVTAVKGEMGALNADLAKIVGDDKSIIDAKSGTRNEFMKSLSRKLDLTVTGFNAFRSDPQLKQIRADLADRADKATFPDTKGASFSCPDPQLSTALKGVVRAIDELPVLEKPKIAAVEGSEATIEAFRRLTATFYGLLSFKMPPSADELRDLQKKAVQSVEQTPAQMAAQQKLMNPDGVGLSKRDYVPLAIALFVDICLLLVSMGRPMNRLGGLVGKMREAERGPVIQILSRFNDIHRDPEIRRNFEVFRHVVFDFHGDYYVAVPLDAPFGVAQRQGKNGRTVYVSQTPTDIGEHQVEAHILANLFTSFEKERIFARVYSPFLTTRTIQKRLARQGSKFAHAKAFRVYRFRDGAWSEIILGAVMGAARRVEAEKRARNLADGHSLPDAKPVATPAPAAQPQAMPQPAPYPTQAADPARAPYPPQAQHPFAPPYGAGAVPPVMPRPAAGAMPGHPMPGSVGPSGMAAGRTLPAHMARQLAGAPGAYPAVPPQPSHASAGVHTPAAQASGWVPPGSGAAGSAQRSVTQPMHPVALAGQASVDIRQTAGPRPAAVAEPSPELVSKYGPYAAHVEPPLPFYPPHPSTQGVPQAAAPANNNTAPAGQIPAGGSPQQANAGGSPHQADAGGSPQQANAGGSPHQANAGGSPVQTVVADEAKVIPMPGVRQVASLIPDVREPEAQGVAHPVPVVVAPIPTRQREDDVTYELKRETLTVTVPVSQVPENLLDGLRQGRIARDASRAELPERAVPASIVSGLAPGTLLAASEGDRAAVIDATADIVAEAASATATAPLQGDDEDADDVIVLGAGPDVWTDADKALLNRLAKRQA